MSIKETASDLEQAWRTDPRWSGVLRPYSGEDVLRLRGTVQEEHTLARLGAERLWTLLHERDYVPALGALTGGQAVQSVKAGLEAIYLSGWQVAADANTRRADLPGPVALPGRLGAEGGPPDQQRAAARGPDRAQRGRGRRTATGWPRSWPTPRPASAARSTRTS